MVLKHWTTEVDWLKYFFISQKFYFASFLVEILCFFQVFDPSKKNISISQKKPLFKPDW
jgi:hypothetical protein